MDSELFERRSLYQFERLSEETHQTISTRYLKEDSNTVNIEILK
jgi:hypothetical protein